MLMPQTPCSISVAQGDDPWWSDDPAEQERAREICLTQCRALDACRAIREDVRAALPPEANGIVFGVWAGELP